MILSPLYGGETEVWRSLFLAKVENSSETELGRTQGPLCRSLPPDNWQRRSPQAVHSLLQEPAGLFALVQKDISSPLGTTEVLKQMGPDRSSDSNTLFYEEEETEARDMNLLSPPFLSLPY